MGATGIATGRDKYVCSDLWGRGCHISANNKINEGLFASRHTEATKGDKVLFAIANKYLTNAKNASLSGLNADGTISFNKWFSAFLNVRGAGRQEGKSFPVCVTDTGYAYALTLSECENLLASPGMVSAMTIKIDDKGIDFFVAFYHTVALETHKQKLGNAIPCEIGSEISVFLREGKVKESRLDIAEKFLRFALSKSNFTFPNIQHIGIRGLLPWERDVMVSKRLPAIIGDRSSIYANPTIELFHWNNDRFAPDVCNVREFTSEFRGFIADYDKEATQSGGLMPILSEMPYGKLGDNYLGEYLRKVAYPYPSVWGRTVEETIVNAIKYYRSYGSVKQSVGQSCGAGGNRVLFDDF